MSTNLWLAGQLCTAFRADEFAQIVFGGVTILVLRAPVERKLILQIVIALVVPLFLSGIFFYEATPTWSTFQRFNWSLLLPISIIGWLSWKYGEVIDDEVPVRNFLIAAAILFVWCWFRRKGMYFEGSFDGESSDMFINSKVAKNPSVAAYYFVLYLLYILVSYASLLLRFKKSRY